MTAAALFAAAAAAGPDLHLDGVPVLPAPPPAPVIARDVTLAPPAPVMPDPIRTMIVAAYKTGNDKTISDVVGIAKANFPMWINQISDLADAQNHLLLTARKDAQEREQARIAAASFLQIWKGQLEAGGSRSTGTTRSTGIYASAALTRDGLKWRHKLNARLDYQETDHIPTTERWNISYQPNYKFNQQLYAWGIVLYEHDRFLGYTNRGTFGLGPGYQAAARPNLNILLEAGPAVRRTVFIDAPATTRFGGRASLTVKWALSPTLAFTEDASFFSEGGHDATAASTTGLETKLIGALKAKLSYAIQFESETPLTDRQLDTVSRATLLYSF